MHLKKIIALLIMLCLGWPLPSQAYDQTKALRGLQGVKVTVKYFNPEMERLLLPRSELEKDTEKKFKKLGVPVFKDPKPPAMSTLFVNIHTIDVGSKGVLVYFVSVSLMEYAYLKRDVGSVGDLMEVQAINWYDAKVGIIGIRSAKEILKIEDKLIHNFIYDYLAANKT